MFAAFEHAAGETAQKKTERFLLGGTIFEGDSHHDQIVADAKQPANPPPSGPQRQRAAPPTCGIGLVIMDAASRKRLIACPSPSVGDPSDSPLTSISTLASDCLPSRSVNVSFMWPSCRERSGSAEMASERALASSEPLIVCGSPVCAIICGVR